MAYPWPKPLKSQYNLGACGYDFPYRFDRTRKRTRILGRCHVRQSDSMRPIEWRKSLILQYLYEAMRTYEKECWLPGNGLEPSTGRETTVCSTTELPGNTLD